jgi:hypothetical protein
MPSGSRDQPKSVSLTATQADPLASLRMWGAGVVLGGVDFEVPPLPAARWLEVLLTPVPDPEAWFPGLCAADVELAVWQLMESGGATQEEFEQVIWDVLEEVSGRPWWITTRLCGSVRAHWDWVGGALALRGVDPMRLPLGAWLDAAYNTMVDGIVERTQDLRKLADWNRALTAPPSSVARQVLDEKANADAFLAALKAAR